MKHLLFLLFLVLISPQVLFSQAGARAGDLILARCTAAGQVDSTFGSMGQTVTNFGYNYNVPTNVAIQPNGKIVVGAQIQQLT
ncbi:MAG TPA: hypothetical protein PK228_18680, partial [Saprospiraceae bacterium]|nr:hypothetical protein [Saprospiraceae bacterium]